MNNGRRPLTSPVSIEIAREIARELRCNQGQLPPVLVTVAVPPLGVQVGALTSLPAATPPLVADTVAKPPSVTQSAVA